MTALRVAAALLLLAGAAPGARAADAFVLSARARWWVAAADGSFQINKEDLRGSFEDFRDDLDMAALDPRGNPGVPELCLEARAGSSRLLFRWLDASLRGTALLDRMRFNGLDYVAERVATELDLRLWTLAYSWVPLDLGFLLLAVGGGAGYVDYRAAADPEGADPGTHTGGNALFPFLEGRVRLVPPGETLGLFEIAVEARGCHGDFGDARLFYLEAALALGFRPVRFASVSLGGRLLHLYADAINVWSGDPDTILVTLAGPYLELEARF